MTIRLFNVDRISFLKSSLQKSVWFKLSLNKHLANVIVPVSCILGFFIVVLLKELKSIFSCSNLIISFSKFSLVLMIWPLNITNIFSFAIPLSAKIVVEVIFDVFEDKFFKLLPLSCKKIFFNSLLIFFSTINVNPLKESLNCCVLTVGTKEPKLSLLRSNLDLFKANGVINVVNTRYIVSMKMNICSS